VVAYDEIVSGTEVEPIETIANLQENAVGASEQDQMATAYAGA
jgi:hypothetical protein